VRKLNIKHIQTKMQEYSATRANKWLPGTQWPQAEDHRHLHHPSPCTIANLNTNSLTSPTSQTSPTSPTTAKDHSEPQTLDSKPSSSPETLNPPNEPNPTFPDNLHEDEDGAGTAPVEHIDTRRCKDREAQTKNRESEQFFHTPRLRTHKKMRSRKLHKLLLAPEALLPFTGLAQHVVVEAGPSVAAADAQAQTAAPVSSSESAHGDGAVTKGCEEGVHSDSAVIGGIDFGGENKYPYWSSMSGSSNNFCTPEIEDWRSLK
jgi:tripartite motif-containing protein 37